MNGIEILSLFAIMAALALLPSTSVLLVVTRSALGGVRHGIAVAAGIVCGDLIFALLAVFGLTVLSELMGSLFVLIRIGAGLYLIGLGLTLLRSSAATPMTVAGRLQGGLMVSFLSGLLVTLGDIKAILFYASLFPVFLDLSALTTADVVIITLITLIAVGGVKTGYALIADRAVAATRNLGIATPVRRLTGGLMIGAGGYLIVKS